MNKPLILTPVILLLFLIVGCSSNTGNPVVPSGGNDNYPLVNSDAATGATIVSDYDKDGNPAGGVATLGMFSGTLNLKTLEVSFTPLRASSVGYNDSLVVDLTNFLTIRPCINCIHLKGISLDANKRPVLTIGIKHPFQVGNQSEPPSGSNRLDLHVFTVRGFIVSNGIIGGGAQIFPGLLQEIGAFRLANASGYSGDFDIKWDGILETRATIHPYILHFDDYSYGNYAASNACGFQNPALPTGNLVMGMGANYDYKDYVLSFPPSSTETFDFLYAVTVSYGMSSHGKTEYLTPCYRVPLYCGKPASLVRVKSIDSKLDDIDPTSWAELTIEVLDINHETPVGDQIDQMDFDSSIKSVSIEVPDMKADPFVFEGADLVSTGGSQRNSLDPLRYKLRITNDKVAPIGKYIGLVKVLDAYPADANQKTGGKNAIPAVPPGISPSSQMFQITEWATYCVFDYSIGTGNRPPICKLKLDPTAILGGSTVKASPDSGTLDPDGNIILYEYDMEYNGETFTVDASNTSGEPVDLGPYMNESGIDKHFTIAMRVTDDGDPGKNSVCTAILTVHHFSPVIFTEEFQDNSHHWVFDAGNFWGIKNGFLSSAGGLGAQVYGPGCYADDLGPNERYATSADIEVPALPSGYTTVRVTIVHAVDTEIFQFNPYDFTDDCDVWVKLPDVDAYKMYATGGEYYNTNFFTSKDGPSFAGQIGTDPAFGEDFVGVTSWFEDSSLAGKTIKLKFRQQTDDGIDNCQGGWWIDSVKVELIRY